jgi:hypothetical protein
MRRCSPLALAAILLLFLSAACGPAPAATADPTRPPAATEAAGAAISQVITPEGASVSFTVDDLKQLPLTTIMSDGSPQEGPTLLSVLEAAGVTEFAQVSLTGVDGSKTFKREEVTAEVILDFNNRGSVKLASPTLPRDERIRDGLRA